jgi:hypothetical protein
MPRTLDLIDLDAASGGLRLFNQDQTAWIQYAPNEGTPNQGNFTMATALNGNEQFIQSGNYTFQPPIWSSNNGGTYQFNDTQNGFGFNATGMGENRMQIGNDIFDAQYNPPGFQDQSQFQTGSPYPPDVLQGPGVDPYPFNVEPQEGLQGGSQGEVQDVEYYGAPT